MNKLLLTIITVMTTYGLFSFPASAGTPYNAAATGMAFASKSQAKSFYSLIMDGDKEAQKIMLITCSAEGTCRVVDKGTPIFLEQQAEYPLIEIRIGGSPNKYWALDHLINFD